MVQGGGGRFRTCDPSLVSSRRVVRRGPSGSATSDARLRPAAGGCPCVDALLSPLLSATHGAETTSDSATRFPPAKVAVWKRDAQGSPQVMEHPPEPFAVVRRQLSDWYAGGLMLADVVDQVRERSSCRQVKVKNNFLFLRHVPHPTAPAESGVPVDLSVTHQVRAVTMAPTWFYVRVPMVVHGQHRKPCPRDQADPSASVTGSLELVPRVGGAVSRRLSVARRPEAVGGRGSLPPAGLAASHRTQSAPT
ncbi:hypothetical protein GA0070612_5753 [Micromonospora chokoriensis]|uniref:Uncharacterized protein n=1 Tax=Micromonospora chokoriensis TaxID=356851 RepID=A0A1C4Z437_9ACTN|nr:hypothetical protein GA0070612_5753 [Micromonospora chokoriensis]